MIASIFQLLGLFKKDDNIYDYTVKLMAIYIEETINNIYQVPTMCHACTKSLFLTIPYDVKYLSFLL